MNTKRTLAALGTSALLALSLTACGGGGSSAPEDASEEDFCNAFAGLLDVDPDASDSDRVDAIHDVADKLEDVGTPSGIDDDARDGFEVYVDALGDVKEDDIDDIAKSGGDPEDLGIDGDDADKADAFGDYVSDTCTDQLLGDLPTDINTDDLQ